MPTPTELKAELVNDPAGVGYTGSDADDAARLNADSPTGATVLRRSIPMGEVYGAVDWVNEWLSLQATRREGFRQLTSTDTLDASSPRIRTGLEEIFGTGSATWANLQALASRPASRAEELWGVGTSIHHLDVAEARSA